MSKVKMETMVGQKYTEVRKVKWDMLWHACYGGNGYDKITGWDRVSKRTALAIAGNL